MSIYHIYLRAALLLGFVTHAYRKTGIWGASRNPKKVWAGVDVSETLVKDHGYHRCPSCTWATKAPNEHIVPGTWCYDEYPDIPEQAGEPAKVTLHVRTEPYNEKDDDGVVFDGNKVIGEVRCADQVLYSKSVVTSDDIESVCSIAELLDLEIERWAVENTDFVPTADALPA